MLKKDELIKSRLKLIQLPRNRMKPKRKLKNNESKFPLLSAIIILGFFICLGIWILIGGPGVSQSATAGIAFAAGLGLMALLAGERLKFSKKIAWVGLLGGFVLVLPFLFRSDIGEYHPDLSLFWPWAIVVSIVAVAEE